MPKKVHDCVNKLLDKGYEEKSAWAICTASIMGKGGKGGSKKSGVQPRRLKKKNT